MTYVLKKTVAAAKFAKFNILSLLFGITMLTANGVAADQKMLDQYNNMCLTIAITIPAPDGESDIKDNPKLKEYCSCFSEKFLERAMQAASRMAAGDKEVPPLEASLNEEVAMRNTCREKYGLPRVDIKY
jgi:hypothetical protein